MLSSLSSTIITVFDIADLPSSAAPFRPRLGLPSFRLVRRERVILKRVAAYLGAYGAKDWWLGPAAPSAGNARDCKNGRTPDRAGNDTLIVPPVARAVLPSSVKEGLRRDGRDRPRGACGMLGPNSRRLAYSPAVSLESWATSGFLGS